MSGTEDTINSDLNEVNTSDPFWFNDYTIIFEKGRLTEFFPSHDMSYVEKLNAILRFSLYTAVVIYVYNRNGNVIFIPFITGLITLYLFKYYRDTKTGKSLEQLGNIEVECVAPKKDNPFMNVLMSDYTQDPERAPACDIQQESIKDDAEDHFSYNLYRDVSDVWNRTHSQRQFYTMPNTQIPNKQKEFAEWLYKTDTTCKENPQNCGRLLAEDIRSNRPISIKEAQKQ
jgi:hypothetical protein